MLLQEINFLPTASISGQKRLHQKSRRSVTILSNVHHLVIYTATACGITEHEYPSIPRLPTLKPI
jgi:hypothetical protein